MPRVEIDVHRKSCVRTKGVEIRLSIYEESHRTSCQGDLIAGPSVQVVGNAKPSGTSLYDMTSSSLTMTSSSLTITSSRV